MAKIVEEVIVVKFSKIVKDSDDDSAEILNSEIEQAIEQVAQELAGEAIVVEVEKA